MDQLTVNEQPIVSSLGNAKMYSKGSFEGNSYEESNLREIVYELDEGIGSIGAKVETLVDVEILMARLMEDMDRVVSEGNENFYFHEFHRKLRVYWNLLNYTASGLNKDFEKASELKEELFDKVMKQSEKKTIKKDI
ncbi:hypothetical protein COK81_05795 [Bacillus thuringiensis]|uniref:Uncharacterized protein n=1 Tax=Bacillus thuringiensis TaxID=1428 RepID=A0A9X7B2W8_BACTU|nr:hypothetical protein [Bacillus thuringiensis]PFT97981.1 hypothetical protein COK81_05795 [Bacillus thuringiensis]